jgi:hypothetical protein
MTWPVRAKTMYMAPFRFLHAPDGSVEPDLGPVLTSDNVTVANGPLYGQLPGSVTRWMAVPWQTDTASCLSGYMAEYDPYVPAFWPARVPNEVLTKENYDIVGDKNRPMAQRRAAFAQRAKWIDPLGHGNYIDQINNMIAHFDHLGVVETRCGPDDTKAFPAELEVEDRHTPIEGVTPAPAVESLSAEQRSKTLALAVDGAPAAARRVDISGIDKYRRFPRGLPAQFK